MDYVNLLLFFIMVVINLSCFYLSNFRVLFMFFTFFFGEGGRGVFGAHDSADGGDDLADERG